MQKEGVEDSDVIFIEANSGAAKGTCHNDAFATENDLDGWTDEEDGLVSAVLTKYLIF